MSADVISLFGSSSKRRMPIMKAAAGQVPRIKLGREPGRPVAEGELTTTLQNKLLRDGLNVAWRKADAIRQYWRLRLDMERAISRVQGLGVIEGDKHPPHDPAVDWSFLANWRQSIALQLLMPAPNAAAVAWKKTALASGEHKYTDVKTARIERAIADDLAFLAAHSTRTKRCPTSIPLDA